MRDGLLMAVGMGSEHVSDVLGLGEGAAWGVDGHKECVRGGVLGRLQSSTDPLRPT